MTYYIKAYSLLIKAALAGKDTGLEGSYLSIAGKIARREYRLHWLRDIVA